MYYLNMYICANKISNALLFIDYEFHITTLNRLLIVYEYQKHIMNKMIVL